MNESPNITIQLIKIITNFFSNNSITILLLVLLIICRNAISNFIYRLTSFSYKKGNSTLGMEAIAPFDHKKSTKAPPIADENSSLEKKDSQASEVKKKEEQWFYEMHNAFSEKRYDDADAVFKKYAIDEKDEIKLEENKALYLYFRFDIAKDNKAIEDLENLARTAKTEESKFNVLMWLSICLRNSMQYQKEINLWQSVLDETKAEKLKIRATVNLAYALNKEGKSTEAHRLLIKLLLNVADDTEKYSLYKALSSVENSLGNKSLSIYCQDKALEFDANNRDELFNSAYAASDENIDEISISNYIKLLRIDNDNAIAINNLGVRAQDAGLKIKAVENYKKSSTFNNTLAMANQGYLLLDAGFTEEAENLAKTALKFDTPHENIHSLVAAINEKKREENKEWDKLQEKALVRQKIIREYTEQYYTGNPDLLKGYWMVNNNYPTQIKIEADKITAAWVEPAEALGGASYEAELKGTVSGSTFQGRYTSKNKDHSPTLLVGLIGNTSQPCIGYISDGGNQINIVSIEFKTEFSLKLLKHKG